MDDTLDYSALARFWPMQRYGRHGDWFEYVGRTRPMREGLVAYRLSRAPRGLIRTTGVRTYTRSKFSGEFEAHAVRGMEGR